MDEESVQNRQGQLYLLGARGYSAYEVAVLNGYVGTEEEWLESLKGEQGEPGTPFGDLTPEQIEELRGPQGKSAYQVAVDNGFIGTEQEWVNSFLTPDGYYNKDEVDLKKATFVNSVNEMKESDLKENNFVVTSGYYESGDGGNGKYQIVDDDTLTDDGGSIIELDNGLFAKLIIENDTINIKQFGCKANVDFDNSTILNNILSTYINIYIPDGNYKISDTINISLENQKIICGNKARISLLNFTGEEIIYINNNYTEIYNLTIINSDENEEINSINNSGFNTKLDNITITGRGKRGIENNAAELRIFNSKIRGHHTGFYNDKPDLYMENVYIEQNTGNGFVSTKGSIEAHHVHSYANNGKGFYLVGSNFSNFYGCYADTNEGNGFEINNTNEANFFGCWDYKSNQSISGYGISVTGSYRNNFIGCKSTSGGTSSLGSFKFTNTSFNNLLIGCDSDKNPDFVNEQRLINCYRNLLKYNKDCNNYYINSSTIESSQNDTFNCKVILDSLTTPGERVFKLLAPMRTSTNSLSYMCTAYLIISDSTNLNNIIYENNTNTYITISNVSLDVFDEDNKIYTLSFKITNNYTNTIQIGGQINYLGTSRSYQ